MKASRIEIKISKTWLIKRMFVFYFCPPKVWASKEVKLLGDHHLQQQQQQSNFLCIGLMPKTVGRWKMIKKMGGGASIFTRFFFNPLSVLCETGGMNFVRRIFLRLNWSWIRFEYPLLINLLLYEAHPNANWLKSLNTLHFNWWISIIPTRHTNIKTHNSKFEL